MRTGDGFTDGAALFLVLIGNNELLEKTNNAFETGIVSNPVTPYPLRGVRLSGAESQPER